MNLVGLLRSKFVKDTATLQVGGFLTAFGNLASTILLAFVLGAAEQGRYFVAISLYSMVFLMLSTGINQATVSQVSAAYARGNHEKVAIWLAFQLKASVVIGLLFFGAGTWLFPAVSELEWMGGNRRIGVLAWWLSATPLIEAPRAVAIAAFQSTRRMLPLAQTENVHETVRVFLVSAGALVTGRAEGAILGSLLASTMSSVLAFELYWRARRDGLGPLPAGGEILGHVRDVPLRKGVPLGVRLGLLRSLDAIGLQVLPMLIINAVVGSDVVAYTRTAQRIMNVPMMLMGGVSRTIFPVMNQLAGLKDVERFKRTFLRTTLIGGSFISVGILLSLPFLQYVVGVFWPPDYVEPVTQLCLIFAIGCIALSFALGLDSFYVVTDSMNGAIWLNVFAIPITAALAVFLCQRYPLTGGAWAITVCMCWGLFHYVYIAFIFRRLRRRPLGEVVAEGT